MLCMLRSSLVQYPHFLKQTIRGSARLNIMGDFVIIFFIKVRHVAAHSEKASANACTPQVPGSDFAFKPTKPYISPESENWYTQV